MKPERYVVTYNVDDANAYHTDYHWRKSVGIPNGRVSYYQNGGGQIELVVEDHEHVMMLRLRHSAIRIAPAHMAFGTGKEEGTA